MHIRYFFFIMLLFVVGISQHGISQNVNWISFEKAIELNKKQPKKIMVDVYTDWCHWCKVMDKETFSNERIAKILSDKFYCVKLNAETKDTIRYKGNEFVSTLQGSRPPHQLAVGLLNGKLSYPSVVFLDERENMITVLPGFHKPNDMEPILMYIYQEMYAKNVSYPDFLNTYKPE
jgi:thioredoxin-related protein